MCISQGSVMTDVKSTTDQSFEPGADGRVDVSHLGRSHSADEIKSKGQPTNTKEETDFNKPSHTGLREQASLIGPRVSFQNNPSPAVELRHSSSKQSGTYENVGHRRARSGDAAAWGMQSSTDQSKHNMFSSYDLQSYEPRAAHSVSMVSIPTPPLHSNFVSPCRPQANNHHMIHSISMDNTHIYKYLTHQTASFVNLQKAIVHTNKQLDELEKEIYNGENELNALLTVESPTESSYHQVKQENELLLKEIKNMYIEFDKLGASVNDELQNPSGNSPSHSKGGLQLANLEDMLQEKNDDLLSKPLFASKPSITKIHKKFSLPTPPITHQPPSYSTIFDPAPSYHHSMSQTQLRPPIPERPRSTQPLSLSFQSHDDMNEHWVCPKCTFENLLVGECEVCFTPRPVTLNRPH